MIRNFINSLNLKQRLIILIIFTALVPAIINYYSTIVFTKDTIQEKTINLIENTVEQVSQNIDDSLLKQVDNIANMLMYDSNVYDILTKNSSFQGSKQQLVDELMLSNNLMNKYLAVNTELNTDIKIAVLVGKNNIIYNISYPPSSDTINVYSRIENMVKLSKERIYPIHWYSLQKNYFTDRLPADIRSQYIAIASKGIFNPTTQEYIGTSIFAIDERTIFNKYSSTKLGESGEIFIINTDGDFISSLNSNDLQNTNYDKELIKKIIDNENTSFEYERDGKNVLVVSRLSKINNWTTVGIIPLNEVYSDINRIYGIVLLIAIFTVFFAIIIVTIISDRVVKPIRTVVKAMDDVEKGNLEVSVNIKGEYEVSKLGKYFNSMIIRIKDLINEQYELGKKVKESELDILMAQIDPHFLYNTLDSIAWMAQSGAAQEAGDMTMALSKMLRVGINRGEMVVQVSEEIEHVKAYMEIQKIRYKDRFDFSIDIANDFILDYKTLKLMLQPLVENSLFYGMGSYKSKRMSIIIKIAVVEDYLLFKISDNGSGISEDRLDEINTKLEGIEQTEDKENGCNLVNRKGVGLKNINDRIKLYFGPEYGIEILSKEQIGTNVIVRLPVMFDVNNLSEEE